MAAEGRGWGPPGSTGRSTGRGCSLWGRKEAKEEEEEAAEAEEDEKTNIKSNNPHLTGGEKPWPMP